MSEENIIKERFDLYRLLDKFPLEERKVIRKLINDFKRDTGLKHLDIQTMALMIWVYNRGK